MTQANSLCQKEGKAKFQVGKAFYNPQSKLVRDLGVLAAKVYRQNHGSLKVLAVLKQKLSPNKPQTGFMSNE